MKKLLNYSLLIFLFSFIAFACSKEDGDMGPNGSMRSAATNEFIQTGFIAIGGYNVGCLNYDGTKWSFNINGPGGGKANIGRGLSHLNLELLDCSGESLYLADGEVLNAEITVAGITYKNGELNANGSGFKLEYTDGSCSPTGEVKRGIVKFEMIGNLDEILKINNNAVFSFELKNGELLTGASATIKTGLGCTTKSIGTCANYCEKVDVDCSYSQGRFFNPGNGGKWPTGVTTVTVGNTTLTQGDKTLPATNPADRAFFQAATLILSGFTPATIPAEIKDAYDYIAAYYTVDLNDERGNDGSRLQEMAGRIGNWIDKNHC